jgi:hypothetical protein
MPLKWVKPGKRNGKYGLRERSWIRTTTISCRDTTKATVLASILGAQEYVLTANTTSICDL